MLIKFKYLVEMLEVAKNQYMKIYIDNILSARGQIDLKGFANDDIVGNLYCECIKLNERSELCFYLVWVEENEK